jgi:hypothetical protein
VSEDAKTSIRERVDELLRAVDLLAGSPAADPRSLAKALDDLAALRELYARNRAAFAERVDGLRRARAALDELLERWQTAIAESFIAADRALRREEALRDACRSLLLRARDARGIGRWEVGDELVIVQNHPTIDLPEAGSEARAALEKYLEESGHWRALSILHRPALAKALASDAFTEEERAAIARWCKPGVAGRVAVRPKLGRPP